MVLRLMTASERAEFQSEFGDDVQRKRHDMVPGHPDGQTHTGRVHDPTRAKPLLVLLWLRVGLERMLCHKALVPTQLLTVADRLQTLTGCRPAADAETAASTRSIPRCCPSPTRSCSRS